jgi:hypothetical protein
MTDGTLPQIPQSCDLDYDLLFPGFSNTLVRLLNQIADCL